MLCFVCTPCDVGSWSPQQSLTKTVFSKFIYMNLTPPPQKKTKNKKKVAGYFTRIMYKTDNKDILQTVMQLY